MTPTNTHNGWRFATESSLDSVAHQWVPARTPAYTGARQGRLWVGRRYFNEDDADKRQQDTDKSGDKRAFRKPSVDTLKETYTLCTLSCLNQHCDSLWPIRRHQLQYPPKRLCSPRSGWNPSPLCIFLCPSFHSFQSCMALH